MTRSGPDVSVVIVTFNAARHIDACLCALEASTIGVGRIEIFLSDNGSTDETVAIVRSRYPSVRVITGANEGYGAGNNRGLARARGRYVLVLNDDTEVRPDALERMIAFMDANSSVGLVGPRLVNADGSLQPSITTFPRAWRDVVRMLLPAGWLSHADGARRRVQRASGVLSGATLGRFGAHDVIVDVESVKGACMLARQEAVAKVGLFDPQFFLFAEETDWTIRFLRAGWRVVYFPDAEVMHVGGSSAGRDERATGRRFVQKHQSHLRFLKKHSAPAVVAGYRLAMSAAIALRIAMITIQLAFADEAGRRRLRSSREALGSTLRLYWDPGFEAQNVYHEMRFRHF